MWVEKSTPAADQNFPLQQVVYHRYVTVSCLFPGQGSPFSCLSPLLPPNYLETSEAGQRHLKSLSKASQRSSKNVFCTEINNPMYYKCLVRNVVGLWWPPCAVARLLHAFLYVFVVLYDVDGGVANVVVFILQCHRFFCVFVIEIRNGTFPMYVRTLIRMVVGPWLAHRASP